MIKHNFETEIKMLEEVYSEMVDAIINKPDSQDYEVARIYFENGTSIISIGVRIAI